MADDQSLRESDDQFTTNGPAASDAPPATAAGTTSVFVETSAAEGNPYNDRIATNPRSAGQHAEHGRGMAATDAEGRRAELESFTRNLVIELTGVPEELIEMKSVLGFDLNFDSSKLEALRNEIQLEFELPPIDEPAIEQTSTVAEVVDLIEAMQSTGDPQSSLKPPTPRSAAAGTSVSKREPVTISPHTVDVIIRELGDDRTAVAYARHLNPVLVALGTLGGWVTTFTRGEGNYLWDKNGQHYLDFVSGCGSLNLGHNPPQIVAAISEAMQTQAPGFAQSALNPRAAQLAEKLTGLAPEGLEMAFFCNSGTEAIEAALKVARLATRRSGLLSCQGSYHGKSLGALSITGHAPFQLPFQPLIPECVSIPLGHERVLRRALETREFAAFVIEPVQGERGAFVAPPSYLRAAQQICRETGTLFVVDEVQTGMGRTGALFACEHENLQPDILTLAKSLGGGLMPIGAMLIRRELWLKAFGSADRFALHTSTFGGGSLACAAASAALDALSDGDLLSQVRSRGGRLWKGLQQLAERYPSVIREVRGAGLMQGLELQPLDESVASIIRKSIENDTRPESRELIGDSHGLVAALPATLLMESLLKEHQIYTLMARSNPLVVRVQPPLTITEAEVDLFLEAVDSACQKLANPAAVLGQILAQAVAP